jgi:hypothetical protein
MPSTETVVGKTVSPVEVLGNGEEITVKNGGEIKRRRKQKKKKKSDAKKPTPLPPRAECAQFTLEVVSTDATAADEPSSGASGSLITDSKDSTQGENGARNGGEDSSNIAEALALTYVGDRVVVMGIVSGTKSGRMAVQAKSVWMVHMSGTGWL